MAEGTDKPVAEATKKPRAEETKKPRAEEAGETDQPRAEGSKKPRPSNYLAWSTIAVGLLLVFIRLLFEHLVLRQPQCVLPAHPDAFVFVEKTFELIDKIGDACVIAGLIGIVVDATLKTKLIQEVVRAASPKLLGQHLPDPIRDALLNQFKINFVRPDWEIEYALTLVDGHPDFVQITSRIQGIVQNCGSDREEYTLISSLDPAPNKIAPGEALITRVSMRPESGPGGFDENPPDNAKLVQPDKTKLFQRRFFVQPAGRFKTVFEALEYRPISSVMPLFTGTTVVKATIRIRYPKDALDVQVSTGTSTNYQPEPTAWGAEWEIPTPLLPGQCIVATWNPKDTLASSIVATPGAAKPTPLPPPTLIEPQPSTLISPST